MVHSDYAVGCDAHPGQPARAGKHFSLFAVLDEKGDLLQRTWVDHVSGAIAAFLSQFPEGTPVALETIGNGHTPATSGLVLDRRRARPGPMGQGSKKPAAFRSWPTPPKPRS
jgi:hypothetical protein